MRMRVEKLEDVKDDLLRLFKEKRIYPLIGAGFTKNCQAKSDMVPDAKKMKNDMISQIKRFVDEKDYSDISGADFKNICSYYKKIVPKKERVAYLKDRFSGVELSKEKKDFLSIDWNYIYTLNIDDAIEQNSAFQDVILPNREVSASAFSNELKQIIKVHGDIDDYTKYEDSLCYIFDTEEYLLSLKKNVSILNKIKHDFTYFNIIYVGCSLKNELDIKFSLLDEHMNHEDIKTKRYYVTSHEPSYFEKMDLEKYGVTDIILVHTYDEFYKEIYEIFEESKTIGSNELELFHSPNPVFLSDIDMKNREYLYYQKSLVERNNTKSELVIPSFFVDRDLIDKAVIPEMQTYNIQVISGGRISGKSYSLVSIIKKVRDKSTYFFDSRCSLNDESLRQLVSQKDVLLVFDTKSISKNQISYVMESLDFIRDNHLNIVISINKSDKDILSYLKNFSDKSIKLYDLDNKLSKSEYGRMNEKLRKLSLPDFNRNRTLLDNLINSSKIVNRGKNTVKIPSFAVNDKYDMTALILLAINEKITSLEITNFNLHREITNLIKKYSPIIDEAYMFSMERSGENNSSYKIYANAKYWLLENLGIYASDTTKHALITDAYEIIMKEIIDNYGIRYSKLEDYIKFDVINEVFFREEKGNILLIKNIYDKMQQYLGAVPQFYHQKAKCYLWHSGVYNDKEKTISEILKSLEFIKIAEHNLIANTTPDNEKVMISLAHMKFTKALIYAKLNTVYEYKDTSVLNESILPIFEGIADEMNREYFRGLLRRRNKKVNDLLKLKECITTKSWEEFKLTDTNKKVLNQVLNYIMKIEMEECAPR